MDLSVARAVALTTREQAADDAIRDLRRLRRQAGDAGRDRSRKLIKTSRIDPTSNQLRYNPAGRLLRDWYLHAYMNELRSRLGEPAVTVDAQQIEDATAHLRRLRPEAEGLTALHVVGAVRLTAVADAAGAAAVIVEHLQTVGEQRAIRHADDTRFDGDELRIHVTRHWYLRCYLDQVEAVTSTRMPLTEVTDAETEQVATVLHTGTPIRLIDETGIPLISRHGTAMTETDRELAAGHTHQVQPFPEAFDSDPDESLRYRLRTSWRQMDPPARREWLNRAGVDPDQAGRTWKRLQGTTQTQLIQLYLPVGETTDDLRFVGATLEGPATVAVQAMFAQPAQLTDLQQPDPAIKSRPATLDDPHRPGLTAPRGRAAGI